MRSLREIERRLSDETDDRVAEALLWVIEDLGCSFCNHPQRHEIELRYQNGENTATFLETKLRWPVGTVIEHIENHLGADPAMESHVEKMREETITTLNTAEAVSQRVLHWIEEWEVQKDEHGMDAEWVAMATRLVGEIKGCLKLVGTLKKEIGVESQVLLLQGRQDQLMRILVSNLVEHPAVLDSIQGELLALEGPVIDVEFEEMI